MAKTQIHTGSQDKTALPAPRPATRGELMVDLKFIVAHVREFVASDVATRKTKDLTPHTFGRVARALGESS